MMPKRLWWPQLRRTVTGLFRGADTMLEQVRWLVLLASLGWAILNGLIRLGSFEHPQTALPAIGLLVACELWWWRGLRRQRFPTWDWAASGVAVAIFIALSGWSSEGLGLLFMWTNFRALYGSSRDKVVGVASLALAVTVAAVLTGSGFAAAVQVFFTVSFAIAIMHTLAGAMAGRDRAVLRERAVVAAGAALVGASSRTEVVEAALVGAVTMQDGVASAAIATTAGRSSWQVVGTTMWTIGHDDEVQFQFSDLPGAATPALAPGGSALLTGQDAARLTGLVGLGERPVAVLAPLSVRGDIFGLLVLALDLPPLDDLSGPVTGLADQAALAFDRLVASERFRVVVEYSPDALFLADGDGTVRFTNPAAETLLYSLESDLIGKDIRSLIHPDDIGAILAPEAADSGLVNHLCRIRRGDGEWIQVETVVGRVNDHDGSVSLVVNIRDVSDRHQLEVELRHAQKLESVGRLAAGIAHEINTPIQFVGDNVRFLRESFTDLLELHRAYSEVLLAAGDHSGLPAELSTSLEAARGAQDAIDVEFVVEEVPAALEQTLDGIGRVATIVRAMKAFGHPSGEEKAPANLNDAIANTLVVANNELKYVADVRTDFADLPSVWCHLGDVNQIVLNLVVNAAHAVAAAIPERGRGTITVTTRMEGEHVLIEFQDTGTGIPPEVAEKVFEPFFTTKEVGTGTGQGLALVRSLVVDRHGGSIDFTTESGVGTTFAVRLPLAASGAAVAGAPVMEAVA